MSLGTENFNSWKNKSLILSEVNSYKAYLVKAGVAQSVWTTIDIGIPPQFIWAKLS